jgi:N-acetyl-alpha-D-muramate 1-phosphate uridylyltransferase
MKGVVLAAGEGTRLRPLTELRPKALCPVGNRALFDVALDRVHSITTDVAANVHAHRDQMEKHLSGLPVHASIEEDARLGTGGALGKLKEWIDGDPVVVTNCDAITSVDLHALVDDWDGERIRLLVALAQDKPDFDGIWDYAGVCVMPWSAVRDLPARDCDLYAERWGPAHEAGTLELVPTNDAFIDCGTPLRYLAANLTVSGGASVIAPDAQVDGEVVASVVWPGARVERGERLRYAIRLTDGRTVAPLIEG